jgi:hypothetical protein
MEQLVVIVEESDSKISASDLDIEDYSYSLYISIYVNVISN